MITEWQPIETAPTDGSVDIFIATLHNGKVQQIDFYAHQELESESWEMPQQYLIWVSAFGNVEEPTHWAPMPKIPAAKKGGAE